MRCKAGSGSLRVKVVLSHSGTRKHEGTTSLQSSLNGAQRGFTKRPESDRGSADFPKLIIFQYSDRVLRITGIDELGLYSSRGGENANALRRR